MTEPWIATHPQQFREQKEYTIAIVVKITSELIGGAVNPTLTMAHCLGELGCSIGRKQRGRGDCTEARRAVVKFDFFEDVDICGLPREYVRKVQW
jgi:hypothetical protein